MKNYILTLFVFIALISCDKKEEVISFNIPEGTYISSKVIDNNIRCFTKNGEITDLKVINTILKEYNQEMSFSDLNSKIFTDVELVLDTINFTTSCFYFSDNKFKLPYNFYKLNTQISLSSKGSVTSITGYNPLVEYFTQLMVGFSKFPAPKFIVTEEIIPQYWGIQVNYITKYLDLKYLYYIENKIRKPITRFLMRHNYTFYILPSEINNCLNENGYLNMKNRDTLLIKEYDIEYIKR